jgi:hypothetical protein
MKTVRDACVLQPHALAIKLSDQIEQLDELIGAEGDGEAFFAKTHITQGMQDLIQEGLARLAGSSSQAIFHLKQSMGGGKTHLLVGFGLLARHRGLRRQYCADLTHASDFEQADIAAFNGRNNPVHYFWGEIANQLGRGEQFKDFWIGGPKAPDEQAWLGLFEGDRPILILLDEMPPYFHYLITQPVGGGTVADIATRAFANLLSAAGKKTNVCVVVSDLAAAYDSGGNLINRALLDARSELGRQERTITPVDLAANEIYDILRKRLFQALPSQAEIEDIAATYGGRLAEAAKAKTAGRGAEAIADEIALTYPFHPRLKNIIALFQENEQFKKTRGLLELVSRLLKSVWERPSNDVFLIGPQHFDLSIAAVRDKLTEISAMRDVIAKDLWDAQASAHAQIIDLATGQESATQLATLVLSASLSTAVNAVKGLSREEMVECLVSPLREPSAFLAAFEELEKVAWYLHRTAEGRYYFDRQENLTKLLQSLAQDAPEPQVNELIQKRLQQMFSPRRKVCYQAVLPLPKLEEVADHVRKGRVLLVISPDSEIPPEVLQDFFRDISQKNNLCVLTGEKTAMASLDKAARQLYAAQKADHRIPKGHPQREDLERKQQAYEQDFNATILSLFDQVKIPIQRPGRPPELVVKPLDMTRDTNQPFDGEVQIEKTLVANPPKLFLDIDKDFEALRDKAQDYLWPDNQDEARWSDMVDRYSEQAAMPWLPPRGLEDLKTMACDRHLWEDLKNGYLTKKPRQKTTSVQYYPEGSPNDQGQVRLRITPQDAGASPRIHYAEDGPVSVQSPVLKEGSLETTALRVKFLAVDPSGQHETGDPITWTNSLTLRNQLVRENGQRLVKLLVAPRGTMRYTLDGSEPREGLPYEGPIAIGKEEVILRAFASADGLETKAEFRFPKEGDIGPTLDPLKPARLVSRSGHRLDSRAKTFTGLKVAADQGVAFSGVTLVVGQGNQVIGINVGDLPVTAQFIQDLLTKALELFSQDTPVSLTFRRGDFTSGHLLQEFADKLGIPLSNDLVEQ